MRGNFGLVYGFFCHPVAGLSAAERGKYWAILAVLEQYGTAAV
jgi:hypothetical protein